MRTYEGVAGVAVFELQPIPMVASVSLNFLAAKQATPIQVSDVSASFCVPPPGPCKSFFCACDVNSLKPKGQTNVVVNRPIRKCVSYRYTEDAP